MLVLKAKFVSASELEARGNYPPSSLLALFDPETGETLNLLSDPATFKALSGLEQFADVAVRLRWRKVNLNSLGGSGRGKAYRLQVVGLADDEGLA